MKYALRLCLLGLGLLAAFQPAWSTGPATAARATHTKSLVAWREWSDQTFAEAKSSKRYVLLHLGAGWCHWCHVMEATTYRDPKVLALIRKHFIPVHVDQDARPDLSRRYIDYGWPATIILDGDGNDIGKIRGYKEPEVFITRLTAILKDPSPVYAAEDEDKERIFSKSGLSESVRAEVERRYRVSLDMQIGGTKQFQRYLSRDNVEYSLALAAKGDKEAEKWLRLTLNNARALIDPAWGGMYQYSTDEDWKHPHYEKIMEVQSNAMLLYALAYKYFKDPAYLDASQAIRRYIKTFLTSPDGAFYTSQDADRIPGEQGDEYFALNDAERRKRGIPRVDTHVYTRENGWMIFALTELYSATGERAVLDEALKAARWIVANRGNKDGSFRHDLKDRDGPFFGDNLAMGQAMLALYSATGERDWLTRAQALRAVLPQFAAANGGGYFPSPPKKSGKLSMRANIDENMEAARFGNLLYRYSGDPKDKDASTVALRYFSDEKVALRFGQIPGILQAAQEAASEPLHITVVGPKGDSRSQALHRAALSQPSSYRRIEWWDPAEGKLLNPDVGYPTLDRPAAFLCTDKTCSSPLLEAADIPKYIAVIKQQLSRK